MLFLFCIKVTERQTWLSAFVRKLTWSKFLKRTQDVSDAHHVDKQFTCLLVKQLDNLIAVLLQVVQVFNLIFVTFNCLSICLLKVDVFYSKQLLFVIEDLIDLKQRTIIFTKTQSEHKKTLDKCRTTTRIPWCILPCWIHHVRSSSVWRTVCLWWWWIHLTKMWRKPKKVMIILSVKNK